MTFRSSIKPILQLCLASVSLLCGGPPSLHAQLFGQPPRPSVDVVEQLPVIAEPSPEQLPTTEETGVERPAREPVFSPPVTNYFPVVVCPAGKPCVPESAIVSSPTLADCCWEAIPQLLTLPNESMGDCFSWMLHSPRVDVPKSLDPRPHGLKPGLERPKLLIEWGEDFLGVGPLDPGIETWTGAVWRPAFWVFGELRTAVQYADYGPEPVTEWANRVDLFGQLNLSGTERILLGLRPFDDELAAGRRFSGFDLRNDRSIDGLNAEVQTLFFEGDFGEIFPYLDPFDVRHLDYGFSVGRMPLLAQQGLLINEDRIDAVTVTRNTLFTDRIINLRMTGVYAWGQIHRNSPLNGVPNTLDESSKLVGLLTESDFAFSTVNADVVYVDGNGPGEDLITYGLSSIRRRHGFHYDYNTSLHLLGSYPTDGASSFARRGELLFAQISWTPHHYEDLIYLNTYLAIDQFTSAARGPLAGGPLGQTGLLFSAPALGRLGAPIDVRTNRTAGASLGYQFFFDETRQQIVWEFGGQQDVNGSNNGAVATGMRYQRAMGQHWIGLIDATVGKRESENTASSLRFELREKF